jgi:hypothetical protein
LRRRPHHRFFCSAAGIAVQHTQKVCACNNVSASRPNRAQFGTFQSAFRCFDQMRIGKFFGKLSNRVVIKVDHRAIGVDGGCIL